MNRARYEMKEALSECEMASCRTFHTFRMAKAGIAYDHTRPMTLPSASSLSLTHWLACIPR